MDINKKFGGSAHDVFEEQFKNDTVGLVTIEDFKRKRQRIDEFVEAEAAKKLAREEDERRQREADRVKRQRIETNKLSFAQDDDEQEEVVIPFKKKISKDPNVDTDFLPDAAREERERLERELLIQEYKEEQERVKNEMVEVTYSYWDGSGHRRSILVKKGTTIGHFLEACRRMLEKEFPELRTTTSEQLMYVKEDLIIPHSFSFYDLIINKARGKSGPLFHFDVHEDIRLQHNAKVEKDESHAGKIVERKWFDRNKHIFPASRWEVYDPNKSFDLYTIRGGEVTKKR
eukprot:GILK01002735.1.p1 GENE.GILK01002735.1~~GILK01002735.1.p1  ORF type:complete len:288 (-),score=74.18 GILK01002735.1:206-1069(-)